MSDKEALCRFLDWEAKNALEQEGVKLNFPYLTDPNTWYVSEEARRKLAKRGRAIDGPYPFIDFFKIMKTRLERGFQQYGDGSFDRPMDKLLGEIEEELLDVVGWSYILWSRIRQLRSR